MSEEFKRPQFLIALLIIGLFAWAFAENVADDTMKGALIGAFNLAIGFYLGSVVSNARATENTGKAFDAIKAAAESTPLQPDGDVIRAGDEVTVEKQ